MASRLDRLVTILETGSTRLIRDTAVNQLADWQKQHPEELFNLLTRVVPYLRHKDWETRSTAAKAIGKIIEHAPPYDPNEGEPPGPSAKKEEEEGGGPEPERDANHQDLVKKEEEGEASLPQDEPAWPTRRRPCTADWGCWADASRTRRCLSCPRATAAA
ncbi:hypothetical protein VTK73DRAFT_6365 [Phialemonium thermophilum]|uniref:Uncharacterized protein n=1 Tax=Phialemonium thermophilum TaxID=223376 RepID=A0ABR3V0X9_9PEZI